MSAFLTTRALWSSHTHSLTLCTLFASLHVVVTSQTKNDYSAHEAGSDEHANFHTKLFQPFNEPYEDKNYGKLNIEVTKASTSSVSVKWEISNLTYPDSTSETTVICETFNGKIVSDKIHATKNSFRFEYLRANTKYIICAYLVETSRSTNEKILHYNCLGVKTIPVVRSDSIVGVILTLGYLFVMGGIGYVTWYRKMRKIKKSEEEERMKIEDSDEEDTGYEVYNSKRSVNPKGDDYSKGGDKGGGDGGGGGGDSGRGGIENYAAESGSREVVDGGANGGAVPKEKSKVDCTGCVRFNSIEEEQVVQYNADKREISF